MPRKMSVLAGAMLAVTLVIPVAPSATTAAPLSVPRSVDSPIQNAQWWRWRRDDDDRDRYWRRDRDWRYDGYYQCRAWRHRCAERWGWGGWEFRRCLYRHGC